jgi:hypothetical protein
MRNRDSGRRRGKAIDGDERSSYGKILIAKHNFTGHIEDDMPIPF